MKTENYAKFAFITLLLWSCEESTPTPSPIGMGTISGTVTDLAGNTYGDVAVNFEQNGNFLKSTNTNTLGNFEEAALPEGIIQVSIVPPLGTVVNGANPQDITVVDQNTAKSDFVIEAQPVTASLVLGDTDPLGEVTNALGTEPTEGDDALYTPLVFEQPLGELHPIMAPDGHQVTLSEWQTATGSATVFCKDGTTVYQMQFNGLIPNGVYTIWNFLLTRPLAPTDGIDFSVDINGNGALGNGTLNSLVASDTGAASLEVTVGEGPLSMFGMQPSCAITSVPGFILVINYHIDGQTHGSIPGPDKDDVAHLLFYF